MRAESIILDVDGTLWNTTDIVAASWERAVRECGIEGVTITADDLQGLFGRTMEEIARALLGEQTDEKRREVMARCCQYEQEDLEADPCDVLYPNVKETIRELSEKHRVFIVSNCQAGYIELFLRKTGLEDCVTDMECYGNNGNSKGENIRLLAERNHIEDAVYVGDTKGDYEATVYAGIPFIFAEYGFGDVPESTMRIKDFSELLESPLRKC